MNYKSYQRIEKLRTAETGGRQCSNSFVKEGKEIKYGKICWGYY